MKPSLNNKKKTIGVASYNSLLPRNAQPPTDKKSAHFNFENSLNQKPIQLHTTKSATKLIPDEKSQ